jgi:poly-beta-1,6-N-acetyl-D-glucosamine synthase
MTLPTYVLITPARNEAQFIELTIQSVVAQTVRPLKWVIVSDGSTDGTDEIVSRYALDHPWIELVRMPERRERHFAGKVHAFRAGHAVVKDLDYSVIGSMDADISFDDEYFSFLLGKLAEDPALGLVGTPFKDDSMYDYRFVSIEHVSGACQLFRRECFEEIGGYVPAKSGGIDHIAVLTARMKGWKTRTFTEKVCLHHRKMGSAGRGPVEAKFRVGRLDYALGGHPVWEIFRTAYQMTKRPHVIGGLALMAGYVTASIQRAERPVSRELVEFRRREQMGRLRSFLSGRRSPQSHASTVSRSVVRQTSSPAGPSRVENRASARAGLLIINADDWGRDVETTDRMFECVRLGTVSSVSAMVFMEDSERAASIARERGVDAGLHLNFTTRFSAPGAPVRLVEMQQEIAACLLRRRLNQVVFHPGLARSFAYVVQAQLDEYRRLYGADPDRIDGHHHMHLCANVLFQGLLPRGTLVRRNFSFQAGEKSAVNRFYRKAIDHKLAQRHRLVDYLFSLPPLESPEHLARILLLARQHVVEVETHPVNPDEYRFLTGGDVLAWKGDIPIAPRFEVPRDGSDRNGIAA